MNLKFRIFSTLNNSYIDFQNNPDFSILNKRTSYFDRAFMLEDKNCIFEPFTGLRDKNGYDIFYNDVLRSNKGEYCYVSYDTELSSFILVSYDDPDTTLYCSIANVDFFELEVVYNRHNFDYKQIKK